MPKPVKFDRVGEADAIDRKNSVVRHSKGQVCPRCRKPTFCDDCGICETCSFATPDVTITQPPAPLPKLRCSECGGASSHERTCSVTVRAAAS